MALPSSPARSRFAPRPALPDDLPRRSPDDMGPALLRLLKAGGEARDVLDVAAVMHAAGRLDPLAVDAEGRHFLAAWMKQAEPDFSTRHAFPDTTAFELFDRWSDGKVWGQADRDGKTVLDRWLKAFHRTGSVPMYNAALDADLAFLLEKTDPATLRRWTVRDSMGPSEAANVAWQGSSLVPYLTVRGAVQSLDVLFRQGHTLLGHVNDDEQRPVAMFIRRPELWQTFLDQGGDPSCTVKFQEKTMALWERLRDEAGTYESDSTQQALLTQLKTQVQDWVEHHAQSALADRDLRDYWERFGFASRDRAKHMKSRPDWITLQDPEGRTPMMLIAKEEPKSVKAFVGIQKSRAGAALEDHEGRNLWSYMLRHGESESSSIASQKWLLEHVPTQADRSGHGVVWQALLHEWDGRDGSFRTSTGKVLPTRWFPAMWEKTADQQAFWWGDEACQLTLATWITDTSYTGQRLHSKGTTFVSENRLVKALAPIVDNTTLTGLNPYLLGALVAGEMFEFNLDETKVARLNRLIDAGALLRIPDDRRQFLTDRHEVTVGGVTTPNAAAQAILSRLEANELRAMPLDNDAPSLTRARSRL